MRVTVLTPAGAAARFPGPVASKCGPAPYAVAAPDGLFWGPTFGWAKAFAKSYVDAGIIPPENVCYL